MHYSQKQRLKELLNSLSPDDQRKLYKKAAQFRKEAIRSKKTVSKKEITSLKRFSNEDNEEAGGFVAFRQGKHLSLEEAALQILEKDLISSQTIGDEIESAAPLGQIVQIGSGCCKVKIENGTIECSLHRNLIQTQKTDVSVGDLVSIIRNNPENGIITSVGNRKTCLSRPDPQNPNIQRVMAANVDIAIILVSFRDPPFRPGLVDRFLISLAESAIPAVLVVNKIDLIEELPERKLELVKLEPYNNIGIPIFQISARTGEGIQALMEQLNGKLCVVIGHSGVGKSSFINCLNPRKTLSTNGIRESDRKGRHTTSSAELLETESGVRIIDTPGIREFGLWNMSQSVVCKGFTEFNAFSDKCRFGDCTHTHEENCGVKEAVRQSKIHPLRYRSYCRILKSEEVEFEEIQTFFKCQHCGFSVSNEAEGTTQRNHCPNCLWSKHLDTIPGDRLSACGGSMEPAAVWVRNNGEWALIHRCSSCGAFHSNRVAGDDNELKLMSLAIKPLAQPPFPLDGLNQKVSGSRGGI
ncbi:MAG: ribosome small subunit-dependent GTPase A [Candidatus Riflebacteria bacterium]|nr:ribosome small subunit-dependent GTPase A [Candidatus Riflebacteria bacterium]